MQEMLNNNFCKWVIVSFLLVYATPRVNGDEAGVLFILLPIGIVWLTYFVRMIVSSSFIKMIRSHVSNYNDKE
jgi:hypothetical protein